LSIKNPVGVVGPVARRAAKRRGLPESEQSFIRGVGTPHRQSATPTKRRAYFLFISGSVRTAKRRTWFAAPRHAGWGIPAQILRNKPPRRSAGLL